MLAKGAHTRPAVEQDPTGCSVHLAENRAVDLNKPTDLEIVTVPFFLFCFFGRWKNSGFNPLLR